jgi:hypothetical protein
MNNGILKIDNLVFSMSNTSWRIKNELQSSSSG